MVVGSPFGPGGEQAVQLAEPFDGSDLEAVSRISIVGASGSGKTRLSQQLRGALQLPVYELDAYRFDSSGLAYPLDRFLASVEELIAGDRWIVDGHYRDARAMIWRRSQLVVWLNIPLPIVLWRLLKRGLGKQIGGAAVRRKAPAAASGGVEPANRRAGAGWRARIERLGKMMRERGEYRSLLAELESGGTRTLELRSADEVKALIATLRPGHSSGPGSEAAVSLELFGLPGAGKTTLTKAIEADPGLHSRHELANAWKRLPPLRRAAVVMRTATDFRLIAAAFRLAARAGLGNRESLTRLVRLLLMKHWLRTRSGTLLFDQGVMQSLWSILYASDCDDPDLRTIEPLVRALYDGMPAQIVLLEVDKAVAAKRIAGRTYGRSRFDGLEEAAVDRLLLRATGLVKALVDAARAAGLPVRTLDGTVPVAKLADQLEAMLPRRTRALAPHITLG